MQARIDKEIHKSSVESAKELRQQIVRDFDTLLRATIPGISKGGGRYWTVKLNKKVYFYVTFEFPKYLEGDSTASIFYGVENQYIKPSENMSVQYEKYVVFPFRIHRHLFEFNNVAWNKGKVGYLYWRLLAQRKKIHYYTREQTDFVIRELLPFAVDQIVAHHDKLLLKYQGTTKELRDLRIKPQL